LYTKVFFKAIAKAFCPFKPSNPQEVIFSEVVRRKSSKGIDLIEL
jgi:hypothetical protein